MQNFSKRVYDDHPPSAAGESSRVVQVSMQIFPLTRAGGGKK
jgi:hypothetical protein